MSEHPHGKETFPDVQVEPPLAQLCAIPTYPDVSAQGAEAGSFPGSQKPDLSHWMHRQTAAPVLHCSIHVSNEECKTQIGHHMPELQTSPSPSEQGEEEL